jgi:HPt (histidine-containing phosphotransfer) domain-containing protein
VIATSASLETDFFARLRVQEAAFSAGLPAMLAEIAARHDRATAVPATACAGALQQALHTLAGCAATFGYPRLGQEARSLEQRLRVLQAFDCVPAVDWAAWFDQLDAMLDWAQVDPRLSCTTTAKRQ